MTPHRCGRCMRDELYRDYHDHHRWKAIHDDHLHFEYLLLETFQAGLSRYTILSKKAGFLKAFWNFDPIYIANLKESDVDRLMQDDAIIRHRGKIEAAITNARVFLDIQQEFGSRDAFIWAYTDGKIINNDVPDYRQAPGQSSLSDTISKDLKKRGMKFIGPTVMYAHLQATGQINDHENTCFAK